MTVTTRPAAIPLPEASAFPPALLAAPHWVAYALEERDGQLTKIPKDPHTGRNASSTAPATWADFHAARSYARVRGLGVGLILAPPLIGIDLDDCRDPATGQLTPIATSVLGELDTYAEVSVSGTGIKAIGYGAKPGTRCRKKGLKIEIYDHARLFALTGQRLADAPLAVGDVHEAVSFIYGAAFGEERPAAPARGPLPVTDENDAAILDWLHEHGRGFSTLWQGTAGDDHSAADLALCNLLAWRTGDPVRVDRLFRASGLYRAKWDERRGERTYGEKTVAKSFDRRSSYYTAPTPRPAPLSTVDTPSIEGGEKDRIIADLRAKLAERDRRLAAIHKLMTCEGMTPIERVIAYGLAIEAASAQSRKPDDAAEPELVVNQKAIACNVNVSRQSVGGALKRWGEQGHIRKEARRTGQCTKDGEQITETVLHMPTQGLTDNLELATTWTRPEGTKHVGGNGQRCPKCDSTETKKTVKTVKVRTTTIACAQCGHVHQTTTKEIGQAETFVQFGDLAADVPTIIEPQRRQLAPIPLSTVDTPPVAARTPHQAWLPCVNAGTPPSRHLTISGQRTETVTGVRSDWPSG